MLPQFLPALTAKAGNCFQGVRESTKQRVVMETLSCSLEQHISCGEYQPGAYVYVCTAESAESR